MSSLKNNLHAKVNNLYFIQQHTHLFYIYNIHNINKFIISVFYVRIG